MNNRIDEKHEQEQYFFDEPTIEKLTRFVSVFNNPVVLCMPMIGKRLHQQRKDVLTLDIDERFADLPKFRLWSIWRPERLDETFDLIALDPPFFSVSLSQMFTAVRLLANFDFSSKVMISYLKRRERALLGTFHPFNLQPTGYKPGYRTIKNCERNEIEFYANFETGLTNEAMDNPNNKYPESDIKRKSVQR